MKQLSRRAAVTLLLSAATTPLLAQGNPSGPISLVVPFAAGGVADQVARMLAKQLEARLRQSIIVENRTGGGGTIAATYVSRAEADGRTLLLIAASHASSKALFPNVPYDAVSSFAPIAGLASFPVVLLVKDSSPYKTLDDLVKDIKARPGRLNNASPGPSTLPGLSAVLFKKRFGLDFTSVTYRGSSPALTAVMAGETEFSFNEAGSSLANIKGGRVRALAVLSDQRLTELPDVPSIDETAMSGIHASAWLGLLAPAGTPSQAVERLHAEVAAILRSPEFAQTIQRMGGAPLAMGPAQFGKLVSQERGRWTPIITELGIKAD